MLQVVDRAAVGHNQAIKSPRLAEHAVEERIVCARRHAVDCIATPRQGGVQKGKKMGGGGECDRPLTNLYAPTPGWDPLVVNRGGTRQIARYVRGGARTSCT